MEPVFPNTPEGFALFQVYSMFRDNLLQIGCFLPLSSVINFTALSKFYNNALNNPKSDYSRVFWKTWGIKTGNTKVFQGKAINYKFKLVKNKVNLMKKVFKSLPITPYTPLNCKNCKKMCYPDKFYSWCFNEPNNFYCNCEIVNCDSPKEALLKRVQFKKKNIIRKKKVLLRKINYLDNQIKDLEEKEKKIINVGLWKHILIVIKNIKENARYKGTRTQAERLFNEVRLLANRECHERPNANYKAPLGSALGK